MGDLLFFLAAAAVVAAVVGVVAAADAQQEQKDNDPPAAVVVAVTTKNTTHKDTSKFVLGRQGRLIPRYSAGRFFVQRKISNKKWNQCHEVSGHCEPVGTPAWQSPSYEGDSHGCLRTLGMTAFS